MPRKRKSGEIDGDEITTPRKTRKHLEEDTDRESPSTVLATPSIQRSILKKTPSKINGIGSIQATPASSRRVLFSAPAHTAESATEGEKTPTAVRNDRSALKRSRRTLFAPQDEDDSVDDEQEDIVARVILDQEEGLEEDDEDNIDVLDTLSGVAKPRGRPKGRRRERTPSPPPDLPPHELYFFQHRAGANKTSSNTLPSHSLLNADDYYVRISEYKDPHSHDIERLENLHKRAFDQWMFELGEGYNICLYGYGSKRGLIMEFAEHAYNNSQGILKLIIINGYTPGLTIKDILMTIAGVLLPKNLKLPAQPTALLDLILISLTESLQKYSLGLFIHSFDHANLRKNTIQGMLARLAAHTSVSMVISCDTLNFPLLWDLPLSQQFEFVFHDATTFQPYKYEIDVVEDVNILLGRSRRSLNGKDGVGYVLKSLPENARNLFRILVAEQLAMADVEGNSTFGAINDDSDPEDIIGTEDEDEAAAGQQTPSRRRRGRPEKKQVKPSKPAVSGTAGVEYRTLYHKAVEEFVCSSEVNFRTLLKEFHDHQIIESRKDALGTERLVVPFREEELETILEELV